MNDWLTFDRFVTPKFITVFYWLLVAAAVLQGLIAMFAGGGLVGFLLGLVILVVGVIVARVFCELLIILFKIHENTERIASSSAGGVSSGAGGPSPGAGGASPGPTATPPPDTTTGRVEADRRDNP